ncbi:MULTISPECIES: pyridoxal-phosphate-dependent aminotransferase family protein [Mammaliicoccus]|jgi:aspartate aminotransferase-like enzyme|uniref:Alanine--glyoxylate aminotransferase family protein n=1 Tax=Mammaliicoccus lentus TaxID=42858 RepID=A0AAX3W025_MAMLE|nr:MULTISPECIES: alanine--glyoxylate aminotransferase family protein [Mammaliicoccus]HBV02681.1 alanine--glyoxylate aminotransferase family protein [Staphylococcus sp.]MBF0750113.1 alanine--glyoxylate aminotransferase family protein [Mammaliicoccus lentus]MBF0793604.1 alanine--glyoxylate aminotransferase family protein [Mammaliicoccus lentus]MBU6112823.1 alanine--glyoxylate aminotransferase family protein [Mammaliicoccus lentus]MBW0761797.1 alanine--glyoxylate aminotransferase family protein [
MYQHDSLLLAPGPTTVPRQILESMNLPMTGHRTKEFSQIIHQASRDLQTIFGAKNPVAILTSSGTSALEAAMVNIVNPDDHIVIIVSGAFGDRFKKIAASYPFNAHIFEVEWGNGVDIEEFEAYINALDENITAVFTQFCETSTSVKHPIRELGKLVHDIDPNIYFVVDGVSIIGAVDVDMERDNIDLLVAGSQKAIMLPPGAAFVAYNDRSIERFKEVTTSRFYLDLNKYITSLNDDSTPFTPAVSLIRGVQTYCDLINEEQFENTIKRHEVCKEAVRAGIKALDIDLLVEDQFASPTVTAFVPNKEEVKPIKDELLNRFNITIAGGQQHLKGSILRVGHMGKVSPNDMLKFISALEIVLSELRGTSVLGKGITKFQEVINQYV